MKIMEIKVDQKTIEELTSQQLKRQPITDVSWKELGIPSLIF